MESKKLSGVLIHLDIFRCSVIVLAALTKEDILKGLSGLFKEWGLSSKLVKTSKEVLEQWEQGESTQGSTISFEADTFIILVGKNITYASEELLVHETNHASKYICRFHGIEDEETEAYLQEYIYNKIRCAQDNYTESNPKKTKKIK